MYSVVGELKEKGTVEIGNSGKKEWSKLQFVIEIENGKYPKTIAFIVWNDKISEIELVKLGSKMEVNFDIDSKSWNGKWFTNLTATAVTVYGNKPIKKDDIEEFDDDVDLSDIKFDDMDDDLPF